MSDLIKKIKIKKEDGTYTDYIPIGADAINVSTNDGESVELKLNKKPSYYNTIVDMKDDIRLKAGDICETLGYYSANDKGGSKFLIRKKVATDVQDDGSIIFLNKKLIAELLPRKEINIKQFGAKGKTNIDDTKAIQNALNYASSKKIKLVIPEGVYNIQTIELKENSWIAGESKTKSIIKRLPSFTTDNKGNNYRNGYMLGYYPTNNNSRIESISLENFTIDGIKDSLTILNEDYEKSATTNNIYIRLCDNVSIKNLIITNSLKSGILIKACNFVEIKNNNVNNNGRDIPSIDANGISVSGNYYSDWDSQKYEYLCKHIKILNNQVFENTDEGIMYANCKDIEIDGNSIINNNDRGIEGDSGSFTKNAEKLNIQITNNYLDGNATNGITEYSSANNINYICSNNIIKNVTDIAIGIGIESDDEANVLIDGNIIENCESQIFNISATNTKVSNNIIKNVKNIATISGKENVDFSNNIIENTLIYSNNIYIKSNNNINIIGNTIKNYLNCFIIQRFNDDITTIPNAIISNNNILNLINLVKTLNEVLNLNINNNNCYDNRDSIQFSSLLDTNSNTITNCHISNNEDKQSLYSINTTSIINLIRIGNTKNTFLNITTRSKPSNSTTYFKKGDIAFSSTITQGSPVGWIFDGNIWHSFGTLID